MNFNRGLFGMALVCLVVLGFFLSPKSENQLKLGEIVVYQSKTCGCCKKWIQHLTDNGFNVRSELMDDVTPIKNKLGIPARISSCHTAIVDAYIVEGHVPAEAVRKVLITKPAIKGISVPGMPIGSPGMEGSYTESYDVIAFDKDGLSRTFMSFMKGFIL